MIPQTISCYAAVAYAANQPLTYQQIFVDPPKKGQIRIKVIANALCHTDIYTLDGCDPQGLFPCILGHEATAVVQSLGEGVTSLKVGDVIIPCYTPQCKQSDCIFCNNKNTNLCPKIRAQQGKGLMLDGTTRFRNKKGQQIYHFMGCSTFSEYSVIAQISAAKINTNYDLNKICVLGCGVSTGWGAAMNNTTIKPGSSVAVWGLGAVGLSVVQAAKIQGASKIYAIDLNPAKEQIARKLGATHFFNPNDGDAKGYLLNLQKWGIQYTYDCTGNVSVMRTALQSAHRGYGQSCVIGVAASGKQIATRPFQLVTGRKWVGTAFGGWKSRQDVPKLVNKVITQQWPIQQFITHQFQSLSDVNKSIQQLHSGNCLRAIVKISTPPVTKNYNIKVVGSQKHFGGVLKTVKHWSYATNCEMTFSIYLPEDKISEQRGEPFPVLYFLAGLTCTHQNAPTKSGFGPHAKKNRLAVVFPDTSPRNTGIQGISNDWTWGNSASFYLDTKHQKYSKYFNMFTYINEQLPRVVSDHFPVSFDNRSITGFSMGGHGALISGLKTKFYKSLSAFAPISHPTKSLWGSQAFQNLLGSVEGGKEWDATQIILNDNFNRIPMFIEVGTNDQFKDKLLIDDLLQSAKKLGLKHIFKLRQDYDHSFYYVSSFIQEHFQFHAKFLNRWQ